MRDGWKSARRRRSKEEKKSSIKQTGFVADKLKEVQEGWRVEGQGSKEEFTSEDIRAWSARYCFENTTKDSI